ncbi:capsule biosynthesis GfcC family protein [Dongshaea marina]|uniref:capsule biosynthesis GfcC family protein n=1 Tax=Dongshaea marina TaxID=2047966 RepID=UPI00131EFD0B|nr:capsule biosynthesis GfcC family protein [Dongshaea marina]
MRKLLVVGMLLCAVWSQASRAEIFLKVTGQESGQYWLSQSKVRVSQLVLKATHGKELWYRGASLQTDLSDADTRALKQKLEQELSGLYEKYLKDDDDAEAASIKVLLDEVRRLSPQGRLLTPLDPDLLRLQPQHDLLLKTTKFRETSGRAEHIELYLPKQPDTIKLMGLINKPGAVTFVPAQPVSGYLNEMERLKLASHNQVYLIQPDGEISQAPVAYWNHLKRYLAPGGTLFVPLAGSDYQQLNYQIATLVARQIRT